LILTNLESFTVMMIIGISLCEPSMGYINGFHYNNYGHGPLLYSCSTEWSDVFCNICVLSCSISMSYRNELVFFTSKTFGKFVISLFWWK
jgi:hypothetical protein